MMFKWFLAACVVGVFAVSARSPPTAPKSSDIFSEAFDSQLDSLRDLPYTPPKVQLDQASSRRLWGGNPRGRKQLKRKREILPGGRSLFKVNAALDSTADDKVSYQDEAALIGAIAGLPPPVIKTPKTISHREGKSNPAFSQSFISDFHGQGNGGDPRTVLHNFPNNQNPKYKIREEVQPEFQARFPEAFRFNADDIGKSGRESIDHHANARPRPSGRESIDHRANARPRPSGRGQFEDPIVRGSLFVNADEASIPISQTSHTGQEGPIIVHSDGRPTLVHLNDPRTNAVGGIPNSFRSPNTFRGRSFQFNDPRIQFDFPPNLFPSPHTHRDPVAFHSSSRRTVLDPVHNRGEAAAPNSLGHHSTSKRFPAPPARQSEAGSSHSRTPAPRTSRQSSPPFHRGVTPSSFRRVIPKVIPSHGFRLPHINTARHPQYYQTVSTVHGNSAVTDRPSLSNKPYWPRGEYSYGYAVDDHATGDQKKVFETQGADGITRGQYSFLQPDGLYRVVSYTADRDNGFRAHVEYVPTNIRIRN